MTAPLDRIEAALAQLGAEHEPPAGWEARVLAAVRSEQLRRPWWRIAVPALTLATAAGIAVLVIRSKPPGPLVLEVVAESLTPVRGEPAGPKRMDAERVEERAVHDIVHVAASGGAGQRAIRVYRNETELVMACPGNLACRVSHDGITVDVTLDKVGDYAIVAIASEQALPAMPGTYDADTAAAIKANAAHSKRKLHAR